MLLKLKGYVTFTSSLCLGAGIAQMLYDYGGGWCAVRASALCIRGFMCVYVHGSGFGSVYVAVAMCVCG